MWRVRPQQCSYVDRGTTAVPALLDAAAAGGFVPGVGFGVLRICGGGAASLALVSSCKWWCERMLLGHLADSQAVWLGGFGGLAFVRGEL